MSQIEISKRRQRRFPLPQDLQEVVVDTSERLSDLISKGVSMELVDVRWILSVQMGEKNACP